MGINKDQVNDIEIQIRGGIQQAAESASENIIAGIKESTCTKTI